MKTAKIVAISSVLALLMVGCGDAKISSDTQPGFEYTTPELSEDGSFVLDLDFSGNDVLKSLIKDHTDTLENNRKIVEALDSNLLFPNKVVYSHSQGNQYDYDANGKADDIGNFKLEESYDISRDNSAYKKSGTLVYKLNEIVDKDGVATTNSKNVEDGIYSLSVDADKYEIYETLDFKDQDLDKNYTYTLSETTLRKYMVVADLANFKADFINFLDHSTSFEDKQLKSSKVDTDLKVEVYCESLHEQDVDNDVQKIKHLETYSVIINELGYVEKAAYKFAIAMFDETTSEYSKTLEWNEYSYTFSNL